MSNDGTSYKPWKVRKGVFRAYSTGNSENTDSTRNTPSPIIEMPLSPPPTTPKSPCSPTSPRVTIVESPLSPTNTQNNLPIIHIKIREVPIERSEEVSGKMKILHSDSSLAPSMKRLKIKTEIYKMIYRENSMSAHATL